MSTTTAIDMRSAAASSSLRGGYLVVEVPDGVEAQREVYLVLPPPRRSLPRRRRRRRGRGRGGGRDRGKRERREGRRRRRGRRGGGGGLPEEGAEVKRVQAAEPAEGEHDGAELLRGAAEVGPVPRADPLPEPLVLGRPPPRPAHARGPPQRRRVRVPQHLEQQVEGRGKRPGWEGVSPSHVTEKGAALGFNYEGSQIPR
ncbi:hypothetical protein Taro_036950 [Colocasia esculenta]|uniref:Uncharacterized protein n=1 Tax=Colocasia esculenta TaxID=4460 RepID=A0A843WN83_COLES|nr:hypothetical protein [Colocasia esculenta]